MAGLCTTEGAQRIAEILFGANDPDAALYLGIYQNVIPPDETATLADISEVSGGGYSRMQLDRNSWTIAGGVATYNEQIWLASTAWETIYGYFIASTPDNTGELLAVQHFPYSYTIEAEMGVRITPTLTIA